MTNVEEIKSKAMRIIESCKTKEQLESAYKYLDLFVSIVPDPERKEISSFLKDTWENQDKKIFS
jgi:hypothetical protein